MRNLDQTPKTRPETLMPLSHFVSRVTAQLKSFRILTYAFSQRRPLPARCKSSAPHYAGISSSGCRSFGAVQDYGGPEIQKC